MLLKECKSIAVDICYKLQPYCEGEMIKIAGSVRRGKQEPKDIEIVCVSKVQDVNDLFGVKIGQVKSEQFVKTVSELGEVIKGSHIGKMMQIKLPEEIMLDLFMPDRYDFYRQYAIRTGSADYSFKVIANGWKKIGWCGSDKGLRKISDCIEMKAADGKSKWKCLNKNAEIPPSWESEKDFFEWIKVKWIEPNLR